MLSLWLASLVLHLFSAPFFWFFSCQHFDPTDLRPVFSNSLLRWDSLLLGVKPRWFYLRSATSRTIALSTCFLSNPCSALGQFKRRLCQFRIFLIPLCKCYLNLLIFLFLSYAIVQFRSYFICFPCWYILFFKGIWRLRVRWPYFIYTQAHL